MPSLQLDECTISYEQFGQGLDIVWIPGGDQRGVHFSEQYKAFPDFRKLLTILGVWERRSVTSRRLGPRLTLLKIVLL